MEVSPIYRCSIGLDVHQKQVTACVISEDENGERTKEVREFGGFKRDRRALAEWALQWKPDIVVMESTGVYWRSPYVALERVGIIPLVVNARHVKHVPGRKTDVSDSQWLAMLARSGLLSGSFIPPEDLRNARVIGHYRQTLTNSLASEKNRLHKVLTDGGVRLSTVVSDIHGKSSWNMVLCLAEGGSPAEALMHATVLLKAPREVLYDALEGDLTDAHRFVLKELIRHITELGVAIKRCDNELRRCLSSHKWAIELLQTIPGIDEIGACMLIIEIGTDMTAFGTADRLASWAGVCPGNNESAGKQKSGKIRKGNPYVRRLLCEIANAARFSKCMYKSKYKSLVVRRGHGRAIVALAHAILKTVFVLLTKKEPYRDSTIDYETLVVNRNAPRWIAKLVQYGILPKTA